MKKFDVFLEPFSFGGLYGTKSKFGQCDVTGDGAMEFFSNRIKITSKWTAVRTGLLDANKRTSSAEEVDRNKKAKACDDKANFDGRM